MIKEDEELTTETVLFVFFMRGSNMSGESCEKSDVMLN